MSDSIENKILAKVKKCGRGSVFFVSDFVNYGTRSSVNKALERLTADGTFMRVARGIYCYPKIMKLFNLGAVPPSTDDIAKAMARRDGAKIIPTDAWAQNQLGLSQQVPMNFVYLTNGPSRFVKDENGIEIKFKHASPRYFTMKDRLAGMITIALKDWGVENLYDWQIANLRKIVQQHGAFPVEDLKLMPANTRELVQALLRDDEVKASAKEEE